MNSKLIGNKYLQLGIYTYFKYFFHFDLSNNINLHLYLLTIQILQLQWIRKVQIMESYKSRNINILIYIYIFLLHYILHTFYFHIIIIHQLFQQQIQSIYTMVFHKFHSWIQYQIMDLLKYCGLMRFIMLFTFESLIILLQIYMQNIY